MLISASALIAEQDKIDAQANDESFDKLTNTKVHISGYSNNALSIADELKTNHSCHYYSDGAWNMHQLLIALLEISGNAHVYISSFAMSETAVRTITGLKSEGMIKSLHCVIDNRVEIRSAGSLQLLKNISTKITLRACHAKATILFGEQCNLIIIGSANYTENKRMEVGFITKDDEVCLFHKSWIDKILNGGQ